MKIKLLVDLPISPAEGMTAGRVLDVTELQTNPARDTPLWYVLGDGGARVGVLKQEATQWNDRCTACRLFIFVDPAVPTSCGPMHAHCAAEHVTACGQCARGD